MGKSVITIVVCFCIILSLVLIEIPKAEALGPTVIGTIRNEPENRIQVAKVGAGDEGVVIFTGEVNVDMVARGDVQKIIIYLTATSRYGWPTIVNPPRITFNPNTDTEIPFRVVVIVPPNTSCYVNDTITVSGDATVFPNEYRDKLKPINMTFKIEQYYGSILKIRNSVQNIDKEEKVVYTLNITNTGNGQDIFNIYIDNLKELEKDGLEIMVPKEVILNSYEYKTIDLVIQTSKDTKPGKYNIDVSIGSIEGDSNKSFAVHQNITLILEIEEDYFIPIAIGITVLILISLIIIKIKKKNKK